MVRDDDLDSFPSPDLGRRPSAMGEDQKGRNAAVEDGEGEIFRCYEFLSLQQLQEEEVLAQLEEGGEQKWAVKAKEWYLALFLQVC